MAEQTDFLRRLHEGAEDIWRAAEDDRRKCKLIVQKWAESRNWRTLKKAALEEEPSVDASHMPKSREPFSGRYQPRSIKRYAAQMLNKDDDGMILEGLKSMMRPSLLLQVSEYFETGAAKVVSHTTPALYFSQSLTQLRDHNASHYLPICTQIQIEIHNLALSAMTKGDLECFCKSLTAHINCASVQDLACVYNDTLAQHHKTFRVLSFLDIIKDFRCYYIDPVPILKKFLRRVVIADRTGYRDNGIAVHRLNELYPQEWVPHTDDACVRRVEYFVYFGSSATTAPTLKKFRTAELLKHWTKDCQVIADLLVHTASSTHVYFDGEFVKDQHLHEQLGTHRVGHEEQFNGPAFWVILRMQVWRTIEDQETTPGLGVSSFSLDTLTGAFDDSCHC